MEHYWKLTHVRDKPSVLVLRLSLWSLNASIALRHVVVQTIAMLIIWGYLVPAYTTLTSSRGRIQHGTPAASMNAPDAAHFTLAWAVTAAVAEYLCRLLRSSQSFPIAK
jgi:hypothetical protein